MRGSRVFSNPVRSANFSDAKHGGMQLQELALWPVTVKASGNTIVTYYFVQHNGDYC